MSGSFSGLDCCGVGVLLVIGWRALLAVSAWTDQAANARDKRTRETMVGIAIIVIIGIGALVTGTLPEHSTISAPQFGMEP